MNKTKLSPSLSIDENLHRSSKRFRPSVQCQHIDKTKNERCSADGFMECVHCDEICCLHHITEHQNELKKRRDDLIQEASDIYLTMVSMQVTDTRVELQKNLATWKTEMIRKIEMTHEKILGDLEKMFVTVVDDFDIKKRKLIQEFDQTISPIMENLSSKSDFYPHELIDLTSVLNTMSMKMTDSRKSVIKVDFGHGITSVIDDKEPFHDSSEFQLPKIILETKPDIDRLINGSCLRQCLFEEDIKSNESMFISETSDKHLLIYDRDNNLLSLFDDQRLISIAHWSHKSSTLNCIKWSSYLKTFFVLCSEKLHSLDCSFKPFHFSIILQIEPLDEIPMKYMSVYQQKLLIKHGNGVVIDFYSLKTLELVRRWSKKDFYDCDDIQIDIHRIELYTDSNLAMNVEINEERNVLDLFSLINLQHIRRIENAYSIVYLPLNNYWIIKTRNDQDGQMNFSLLDQYSEISRLKLNDEENIYDFHLLGTTYFVILRRQRKSMLIQWYYIDHF